MILVCAALGCLAAPWDASPCAGDDVKSKPASDAKPAADEIIVFGKELNQLIEKVPSAVILTGDKAKEYLEATQKSERRDGPAVVVQQCVIRGELQSEAAVLHIEITAHSERDGRSAVPIGMGDANLMKSSIDGRPPLLSRDNQGWVAWVEGKGQHAIVLDAQFELAASRNLQSLVFAIPEAPLATLDLRAQRAVSDVRVVPAAPVIVRAPGGATPQIEAALGSRGVVDLRWRWSDAMRREPPPLVRAESLVTATIDTGIVQMRTELSLLVLLGSQSKFELRTGPKERVLDVRKRDGTEVPFESRAENGGQRVAVQLPEAVIGGAELVVTSQIPWSGETASLGGLAVDGAFQHRITLVLRPAPDAPDFDIAVTDLANVRRIGLEALPAALRSPRNETAFLAYAQPFQVKLSVLPRRPSPTVRATAVLALEADQATVIERWQFTMQGGRLPHVDFLLPENFDIGQFVLADGVQTVRLVEPNSGAGARVARVFLKGMPETFDVRLRAVAPVRVAQNLVKLDLPWPRDARCESSRLLLASSTDSILSPTPDFTAMDEPLDSSLAAELAAAATLRSFHSRVPLNRVAVRVSPLVNTARFFSNVQVRADAEYVIVRQSFDYRALGTRFRERRFDVPAAVRETVELESPNARVISDTAGDTWLVRVDGATPDPAHVQFRFRVPLEPSAPADGPRDIRVPLIQDHDGLADATDLALLDPETNGLEIDASAWKRVVATSSEPPAARQLFRRFGAADHIALRRLDPKAVVQPRFLVERAFVETIVGPSNEWHTHARYLIVATGAGRLRLLVPEHGRITQVFWAGRAVPTRFDAGAGVVELPELSNDLPGILDVESESVVAAPLAWLDRPSWDAPVIVGDVSWGRVLRLVRVPDRVSVLRGPSRYSDENRLAWLGTTFGVAPRMDSQAVARWLGDASPLAESDATGQAYLFSRLNSVYPAELVVVSRWHLVLISSGAILVLGLVLSASPARLRVWLFGGMAIGVFGFVVLAPLAAIECARSAGLGVLLVLVAAASQAWLSRRGARRQTVFPEAGVLAKAQASSHRSSTDFTLGAAAEPVAQPAPTTTNPRRVARSSSVQ